MFKGKGGKRSRSDFLFFFLVDSNYGRVENNITMRSAGV